ncbi:MAG: AtpZ/AtpI family protein [Kiloniellales bacterium]
MTEGKPPPSLDELNERLREARARSERHGDGPGGKARAAEGLGLGLRVATELVAALVVGVGIGLLLDYWLGTKPWMLVVFFFLGAAAGFLNVYRTMAGLGGAVGYASRRDAAKGEEPDRDGRD